MARFIMRKRVSPIVEVVEHRTPPRFVHTRVGNKWLAQKRPAGTRSVEIRTARFIDRSKDYQGRLGAKDKARQARALGQS